MNLRRFAEAHARGAAHLHFDSACPEYTARCCAMLSIRLAWQAVAIDLDDPHQIIGPVVGCVSKLAAAQPDEVVALGGDQMRVQIFGKPRLTSAVIAPRHTADTPQSLTCTE